MGNANYLYTSPRQEVGPLTLGSAATFVVDCTGFDTLMLQINYVRNAGTALTFTFSDTAGVNDTANAYGKAGVDYTTGTITLNKPFTVTSSANWRNTIPFSLTGLGLPGAGRVTVTVTGTATNASDTVTVTPILARVA